MSRYRLWRFGPGLWLVIDDAAPWVSRPMPKPEAIDLMNRLVAKSQEIKP